MSHPTLSVRLLGEPQFQLQGKTLTVSDKKGEALLAYLAARGQPVSRADLAELFWGAGKLNNLRQVLYKLRQLDGAEHWLGDDDPLVLKAETDLEVFEKACEAGAYSQALSYWQGDFLQGVNIKKAPAFSDWLELERSRLEQLHHEVLDKHLEELEANDNYEAALPLAQDLLKRDPLNETAHRSVIKLEYLRGNTEAALEQFEKCRELLRSELGVEPLPETLALLAEIEEGGAGGHKRAFILHEATTIPAAPEKLIGREGLLAEARDLLSSEKRLLVHGFGGIGKTALAATLAQKYLDHGKVLWLELGQDDPHSSFDAIARAFDAQPEFAQTKNRTATLEKLLKTEAIKLVVLDDVWNAYTLSLLLETLPQDLPVLITSRQRYPRLKRLNVGRLERQAALDLLSHHAEKTFAAEADKLCDYLGDHAYALRIAGINLKTTGLNPTNLLARIQNAPQDLRLPAELSSQDQGSIANLLQVSLEPLPDRAYDAFLAYGALFSPSVTPELLAHLLARDVGSTEDALFSLVEAGLAERSSLAGSDTVIYRVHDLAQRYSQAVNNHRLKTVIDASKRYLETHANKPEVLEAELANILGAVERADEQTLLDFMRLLTLDGAYYLARGHNPHSMALLRKAIDIAKRTEAFETAHYLLGKLGDSYQNLLGDLDKALAAYQEAAALAQQIKQTGREAVYLSACGIIRLKQEASDADDYLEKAYRLAQESRDDLCLCTVLEQRGFVEGLRQNPEKARDLLLESLEALERLEANKAVSANELLKRRFFGLLNLGQTEFELGAFNEALITRQKSLALAEACDNELWMADALHTLGETLAAIHDDSEAAIILERALMLYEQNQASAYANEVKTLMQKQGYALPK